MESNDVWDGSYPVVFNEVVCYDEDMLAVVICDADLLPGKNLQIFYADPIYALNALSKDCLMALVANELSDHDDIPKSVEALIDDFVERVKQDKTVLRYGNTDRDLTLTDAQVNSLCAAVQKVKDVRAAEKRVSESYPKIELY
jgi:hypothetical protein